MKVKSFGQWLKDMADIGWALFRSYLYQCRNPLNYRVISKSTIILREYENGGSLSEDITFVGVVQDIPDVTDHSIIHKWVVIKTFYGGWEDDNNSNA